MFKYILFIILIFLPITVLGEMPNRNTPLSIQSISLDLIQTDPTLDLDPVIDLDPIPVTDQTEEVEYPIERGIYLVKDGMPKNTRHLKEGYWISSLPDLNNIDSIKKNGIKIILTVTSVKKTWIPVKRRIEELGIEHIIIPVGSRFPQDTSFYDHLLNYEPNEILIHCDHGGDRSGVFIAYLLIRRNHWSIQRALFSMLNPSLIDIKGLQSIFSKFSIEVNEDDRSYIGLYSGQSNHGFGGLKARNEDYQRLISTMLTVILLEYSI